MKTKKLLTIVTILSLIWAGNFCFAQTAEELLPKAIQLEEVKGELEEAIEVYQLIVTNFPDNKPIAAKAQFRIGLCYEKLGLKEAQKAYRAVVNNYPGQQSEVTLAKERLSMLIVLAEKELKTPLQPKFTKIKIPTELSWNVALSPDGKNLALVSDKKLWKMPLSGNLGPGIPGTPVQLNTDTIEVDWTGLSWSRDGFWIAFNETTKGEKRKQGIYMVSSEGGKPKKIVENNRGIRVVNYRISLSPNGKKLAYSSVEDKKQFIHTISVDGTNPVQLTEMEAREPVFSPDGKMIAYVEDKNTGTGSGDLGLWVVPVNDTTHQFIANAGMASSPVWSPDGNMIAYLDNSDGKKINIVPVSNDEESTGNVTSFDVPKGIERVIVLAGWTPDNKIGVLVNTKVERGLYTLPAKGGQAAIVLDEENPVQPRWSPDSKKIYYTQEDKIGSWTSKKLAVISAEGGSRQVLPREKDVQLNIPYQYQSGNRVSPDGKMIISAASSKEMVSNKYPGTQIWKIPIDGGTPTQITNPNPLYGDFAPCWSPNGDNIAFLRVPLNVFSGKNTHETSLYTIKSTGGDPELLMKDRKFMWSSVWSPDGKMIAYHTYNKDDDVSAINVVNIIDGKSRMVTEIPNSHVHIELAWSPDSKRIAFNDHEGKVIKLMSLSDGSIEGIETNLVDVYIYHLDWSPDGERFVFAGMKGGKKEFWFMENFLPKK